MNRSIAVGAFVLLVAGCQRDLGIDLNLDQAAENPPAADLINGIQHESIKHRELQDRDILWVVADCRSMTGEHLRLRQQAAELMAPFVNSPDNWHVGMMRAWAKFHGAQPPENEGALFTAGNTDIRWIDPDTVAPADRFVQLVDNLSGNGWEGEAWAYRSLKKALTEPRLTDENEGFFRPTADLDIIFVSDVNEDSYNVSVEEIAAILAEFKAHRWMVRTHSVTVPDPGEGQGGGCGEVGRKFHQLTDRYPGVKTNVCDDGLLDVVEEIGDSLRYQAQWYYLKDQPVPESIQVKVTAGDQVYEGLLLDSGASCDSVCASYRYAPATNAIRFEGFTPPPGAVVDVTYERLREVGPGPDTDIPAIRDSGTPE